LIRFFELQSIFGNFGKWFFRGVAIFRRGIVINFGNLGKWVFRGIVNFTARRGTLRNCLAQSRRSNELYETEERLVDWLRYSYAFQRWLPADTKPKEGETEDKTAARVAMQRDRLGRKLSHEIRSEYLHRERVLINTSKDLESGGRITRAIDEDTRADIRLKHLKEIAKRVRPYDSNES
jgi:hypothetical protein